MIAVIVDDEAYVLKALTKAVAASPDITAVVEFGSSDDALEWVRRNPVDIAFLDISMRGTSGLELATHILAIRPECSIVFCTGYTEYAVEAFHIHASGYLLKPITAEAVQREIDHIRGVKSTRRLLSVRCFGSFEVYMDGKPVRFRRKKSKELLACLVDRNGAGATAKEICARLWEDGSDDSRNMVYLRQLFADLRHALNEVGAKDVLVKSGFSYSIEPRCIDCDYFQYLSIGEPKFLGAYMEQYSWAEETCAMLWESTRIR